MRRAHGRLGGTFLLTCALAVPAAAIGCASTPRGRESRREARRELDRVYDLTHGDYHSWNDREDVAYRQYLLARHRSYRVFSTLKIEDQRAYWAWRHSQAEADRDTP